METIKKCQMNIRLQAKTYNSFRPLLYLNVSTSTLVRRLSFNAKINNFDSGQNSVAGNDSIALYCRRLQCTEQSPKTTTDNRFHISYKSKRLALLAKVIASSEVKLPYDRLRSRKAGSGWKIFEGRAVSLC